MTKIFALNLNMQRPQLSFTCPEKWAGMNPSGDGRHCLKCDKVVRDFSAISDAEILQSISKAGTGHACGSFRSTQLEKPFGDRRDRLVSVYQSLANKLHPGTVRRFVLLGLASTILLVTGCMRRLSGVYAEYEPKSKREIRKEQKAAMRAKKAEEEGKGK